jgi:DNA-binding MarR family transcriptional regulator
VVARDDEPPLSEAFWGVARWLRRRSSQTLAPWDITPSQSRAISVLDRRGEIRLSELSDHLRIAPRSTTEVIDGLEQRSLVERLADPRDRRATLVRLTPAGRHVAASISHAREAESERFFSVLTDSERRQLGRLLRKLGDGERG